MTLVIAGHYLLQGIYENDINDVNGLFAVSDSNITESYPGSNVLINDFQKVAEISIKVKSPNFLGGRFNSYLDCRSERSCFIAFAGSTLVAQHLISEIRHNFANFYPTYEDDKYKIVMCFETKRHIKQDDFYGTNMFKYHHLDKLLSAEYLSEVVNHSIKTVLDNAKKNDEMNKVLKSFHVELILGVRCPKDENFRLYQYEIVKNKEDSRVLNSIEIPVGRIAVIGLKDEYADKALSHFTNAIKNKKDTADEMHNFLAEAIEKKNSIGSNSIGKPCILYQFKWY